MRPHTTNGNHSHALPKIQSDTLAIYSNAKNSANIRTFHKHSLKNLKNRVGCLTEVIFNPEKSKAIRFRVGRTTFFELAAYIYIYRTLYFMYFRTRFEEKLQPQKAIFKSRLRVVRSKKYFCKTLHCMYTQIQQQISSV